jgi:multidrug transporter EmrE-like cation transporter
MKNLLAIVFSVLMGVFGQICLKYGMINIGKFTSHVTINNNITLLIKALSSPIILLGFLCYGISALSWLVVLSRVELSYAYPMVSIGYILVVVLSWILFNEHVTFLRLFGVVVVCCGVLLISFS